MTTSITDEMVDKLRRYIGDTDEDDYIYSDSLLEEYIADAVSSIQLKWTHDYEVDREEMEIEPEVPEVIQYLFLLEAKYTMLKNRPDVNFSVGTLSVRRGESGQEALRKEIDEAIAEFRESYALGKSTTEHTQYGRRLEDWLQSLLKSGGLKDD